MPSWASVLVARPLAAAGLGRGRPRARAGAGRADRRGDGRRALGRRLGALVARDRLLGLAGLLGGLLGGLLDGAARGLGDAFLADRGGPVNLAGEALHA